MSWEQDERERRPAAYVGAIAANIIMIWVVNAIPGWNWQFITEDFTAVLWALNLSLSVQIAGNALLLFVHPRLLHYVAQAAFNVVSLLALVITVTVFPFDFSGLMGETGDLVARIVLYVAIGGTGIALVVNALKAVGSLFGAGRGARAGND